MDFRLEFGATPLDPSESEGLIPYLATQSDLNRAETRNIVRATLWAQDDKSVASNLLDAETLRLIHRKMFDRTWRWAGRYRITQKSIGVEAYKISSELKMLTEDVKAWIEFSTYPHDEIAVRFHHRLVLIHPFPNGNGRHARLATDLLCKQLGIPPFSWGANSRLEPEAIRRSYIQALQRADAHELGDLLGFVRS